MKKTMKMSWDIDREKKERELFSAIRTVNSMPNSGAKKVLVKSLEAMKKSQRRDNKIDLEIAKADGIAFYHNGWWSKRHYPGKTYEEAVKEFMKYDYYGQEKKKGMYTIKYKVVKQGDMWTIYQKYDCAI